MSSFNQYQSMHYNALYGKPKSAKKEYALFENGVAGPVMDYALLQHLKKEKIKAGTPAYLLKIKRVNK